MPVSKQRLLALDFETTGLRNHKSPYKTYIEGPQGIQIGAVVLSPEFVELGSFESKIRFVGSHNGIEYGEWPDLIWEPEAERIHKISVGELITQKMPRQVALDFAAFLNTYFSFGESIKIVGHNVETDVYYLHQLLWFGGVINDFKISHRTIDTSTIGWLVHQEERSEELFKLVSGKSRTKHDALEDARLAAEVLRSVHRKI